MSGSEIVTNKPIISSCDSQSHRQTQLHHHQQKVVPVVETVDGVYLSGVLVLAPTHVAAETEEEIRE